MISTKDQERAALKKIESILESLGENSYIATAFTGCLEIAAENIENGFACSMQDQRDSARRDAEQIGAKLCELRQRFEAQQGALKAAESNLDIKTREAATWRAKYEETRDKWTEQYNQQRAKEDETSAKLEALELENIKLKAKLYDLLTK